jgi:signal transduction histidine kinase/streptogramin lyase
MRLVLSVLLLLSWCVRADTGASGVDRAGHAADDLRFQSIDGTRPFPLEIITELLFDRTGFLWIGTREGLLLNDGQRFRRFQHEAQNPDSISSNGIRGVFEDSRGRLWINTISGGLNLLDRADWTFRSWRHQRNNTDSLIHDGVFALAEAPAGRLWVGTQAGLDLFDPDSGMFTRTVVATGGEFAIALMTDREDRLWVATLGQGLFREREDRQGFEPVPFAKPPPQLDVFALAQDADGTVWAGTRHGLYRVDAAANRLLAAGVREDTGEPTQVVTVLLPSPDGGLWVGTFGNGLFWKSADSESLFLKSLAPEGAGAMQIDSGALAFAPDGTLFVGTFGSGLLRASPRLAGLRTWQEGRDDRPGLTSTDVYILRKASVPAQSASHLLVGSFGGGIDEIQLPDGSVIHHALPGGAEINARLNGITDLLTSRDGVLWATTNEGVFRWNQQTNLFHYYSTDGNTPGGGNPEYSYALLEDRQGRIWIGSAGGGLFLHQAEDDAFRNFRPVPGDAQSLPDDFVTVLMEDRRNRVWVGTRSGGIGICELGESLRCQPIATGLGTTQVSHYHITSLLEAPDGSIWAGTHGGGLNRLLLDANGAPASVERWTRNNGLDDDNVMSLVYAPDGALWFSTHGGLSRLDPDSASLTNLTPADGLPTATFNPKAALLENGRLYFGSAKGVVSIDPSARLAQTPAPVTIIESISGLDPSQAPDRPAWELDSLRVAWRTPLALDLAVLGYGGGQPRFQYRMDPADAWTDLGDHGQLTLHALAPGPHRLEVRGRLGGNSWTLARPLTLQVVPPWWRATWVQASAALLLLFALTGAFWWRVRELETRNRELHRVQRAREQALDEAQASQQRLGEAFAMLRRMTMRLEMAKEKERTYLARELHDEFGQALTTAKINLGLALQQSPSGPNPQRVRDAIGVIDRLIGQVRALSLDLRPPLLDEMGLVPALESFLHGVCERSGLSLKLKLDPQLSRAATDREISVFRIVQEAVTNVIRHAEASELEVQLDAVDDGISIRVRDDGAGFDATETLAASDSGLGLFGMRERVHDLDGHWSVESRPGCGTLVTAFIPGGPTTDS